MLEEVNVSTSTRSGVVEAAGEPVRDAAGELHSGVSSAAAGVGKAADPVAGAASDAA